MEERRLNREKAHGPIWGERGWPGHEALQAEIDRLLARQKRLREIGSVIWRVLFVAMAVVLFNIYVARIATVNGASMEPTLRDGDVVIYTPIYDKPKQGDIVLTNINESVSGDLIKRVIAVAGDTVDIDYGAGTVTVNGKKIEEPYLLEPTHLEGDVAFPAKIPEGRVFLLGDNRNNSVDSRRSMVGMVPLSTIQGKVLLRFWPVGRFGPLS